MTPLKSELRGLFTAKSCFSGDKRWVAIYYDESETPGIKNVFYGYGTSEQDAKVNAFRKVKEYYAA
jgi:hypothetical protein